MFSSVLRAVALSTLAAGLSMSGAAFAAATSFDVALSGQHDVPPIKTDGSGTAKVTYDPASRKVEWTVTYKGLKSPVTMAHFHLGAEGANGPPVVWLTKKGDKDVKSPIVGSAVLTPDQAKQFLAGAWYVNVHTKQYPDGVIRGQVTPPKS
jgi:YD repeat-containing protein